MPAADERPPRPRTQVLLIAMFVIYLALLVWVILWKLEKPWVGETALLPRPLKLVPFVASGDAGASNPEEVVANILFFVPFGLYLGTLAPLWRWWQLTAVFLGASLVLETAQHLLSTGSFDTSDLISNTAGGLVGLGILALARRRFGARLPAIGTRVSVIGTAVSLIAIAALIVSPFRYGPQHDVIVPRHANGASTAGEPRPGDQGSLTYLATKALTAASRIDCRCCDSAGPGLTPRVRAFSGSPTTIQVSRRAAAVASASLISPRAISSSKARERISMLRSQLSAT